ncbi:MAG: heme-binding protein [Spirochaetales bacterium]|nr:heme-binding protein [Spirochaetales bacterium]
MKWNFPAQKQTKVRLPLTGRLFPQAARLAVWSVVATLGACSAFVKVKEPGFQIQKTGPEYEVRRYGTLLVAETKVQASFDDAGGIAHRLLFGYISGENRSRTKIAMTAPVTSQYGQEASEKIAMTAPVTMEVRDQSFIYQFVMPAEYTLETLPVPNDSRVVLKEIGQRSLAVHRYSGFWSEGSYLQKVNLLRTALERDGLKITGQPVWSRYNPPFTPWFLRKNEIWMPVE